MVSSWSLTVWWLVFAIGFDKGFKYLRGKWIQSYITIIINYNHQLRTYHVYLLINYWTRFICRTNLIWVLNKIYCLWEEDIIWTHIFVLVCTRVNITTFICELFILSMCWVGWIFVVPYRIVFWTMINIYCDLYLNGKACWEKLHV